MKKSININKNCFFTLLVPLLFFQLSCKKQHHYFGEEIEGTWELQQLVIDGHDTTAYIKSNENCYGYTHFFIDRETGVYYVENSPVHPSSNYYCWQQGYWTYTGSLIIDYPATPVNTGPYLAGERITWEVLEKTDTLLRLHVIYQNMPCDMILKRKS